MEFDKFGPERQTQLGVIVITHPPTVRKQDNDETIIILFSTYG